MWPSLLIGTAHSKPNSIVYGTIEAVPLPTGSTESFPVIVAQGKSSSGPVLWLTANIHGAEYDGIAVIHGLLTSDLLSKLTGTIVAIPTLSPAGLLDSERSPHYLHGKDPNRLFPDLPILEESNDAEPLSAMELAFARVFERIDATADYLIDLHNYGIRSIPFAFRDPIFYREPRDRPVAAKLQHTLGDMLDALGLTVVNEYPSDKYLKSNLHRSVSGSALNRARIPAVTIEIGGQRTVNTLFVQAVSTGIRNVMRWAGMLPGPFELMPDIPVIRPGFPVRRTTQPHVSEACLVHYLVEPGDRLETGDPVAKMVDIYGKPVGPEGGLLRTGSDGFVLGLFPRIAFYPNEPIMGLAVRDDSDLVVQFPD
jgi:predicted deacylase